MTIYYILLLLVGLISIFTFGIKDKNKRNLNILVIISFAIIILQGLRKSSVGVDLFGYLKALEVAKFLDFVPSVKLLNYEVGYLFYSQFFAKLNVPDQFYIFIVAVTIIMPITYIWIKNTKMPGLSVFIYLTLGFFTFTFSGLRQSIALAITFFSFKYIQEKKFVKFLLLVLLAMSFHTSAIVFIMAYPLYHFKLNLYHFLFIIPSLIIVFILKSQIFVIIYKIYRGYKGEIEVTNAYTMLIVMIFVLILAYIFANKEKTNINLNAYRNYMLIAIIFQIFASQSNMIMRAGYYYFIFITLLLPEVIQSQRDIKIRIFSTIVVIASLVIFFQVQTGSGYLNVSPYYFFWE
ncbi:MAG: polysaccharide polymerase [Fusobacteria bacterium]|nr:MAG: polysaccharide polymerase [Fusobacteriota bacterium]KAF0229251.1 MAG: polysaccharide [Fusobacteriota bacterium]